MRDIYTREKKLKTWTERIKTELEENDKLDVLLFVEYMLEREKSILWIVKCITVLIQIRRQLGKPFRNATKEDIKLLFRWMEEIKHYKISALEKFRSILKLFYKIAYGNKEYYPKAVKWQWKSYFQYS
jgi:hypothetical protein